MGLELVLEIDEDLVIPDRTKSIVDGAILPWGEGSLKEDSWTFSILRALSEKYKFRLDTPVEKLSDKILDILLYGLKGDSIKVKYEKQGRLMEFNHAFEGIINNLKRRYIETNSDYIKNAIENYMNNNPCPGCKGARLKREALSITVGGKNIYDFCSMPIKDELKFLNTLNLSEKHKLIGDQVLKEIKGRLKFLIDVGLDYLSLARSSGTLSGGESQRIRLATQIGSGLVGVLYILDEPSIGLHQRDNDRLIETLKHLRDIGNTLVVVEHDEDTMKASDYIVDVGPGAGEHGGEIVAQGTINDIMKSDRSLTGQYLSGKKKIEVPKNRRTGNGKYINIIDASENNLKNINVKFPLGSF